MGVMICLGQGGLRSPSASSFKNFMSPYFAHLVVSDKSRRKPAGDVKYYPDSQDEDEDEEEEEVISHSNIHC